MTGRAARRPAGGNHSRPAATTRSDASFADKRTSTTPCRGTFALKRSRCAPRSRCRHKSRTCHAPATPIVDELGDDWSVLLLTDGVYEGKAPSGRLGESGLIDVLQRNASLRGGTLLDAVIDDVQSINGGDLDDDLAMVWFGSRP